MLQALTTYRKDYTWPFVRSLALRPVSAGLKYASTPDPKGSSGPKYTSYEEYQNLAEERNRCLRKTGKLPEGIRSFGGEPKVGLSKLSEQNRVPVITSNGTNPCQMSQAQANVTAKHLTELQEKHPHLFNILKSCPPDDLITRVFNDRYRSVYMVDYGKEAECPNLEYDRLAELAEKSAKQGLASCPCRDSIIEKYPNDHFTGNVTATKRGQNNECNALAVQKPQRGRTEEQNEVCYCEEAMNIPRYGRCETAITKKDRAAVVTDNRRFPMGSRRCYVTWGERFLYGTGLEWDEEFLRSRRGGDAEGGGSGGRGLGGVKGVGGGSGIGSGGGAGGRNGSVRRARITKLSYNTEYSDAFGKLGELIISSRLHARGNDKGPASGE